MFSPVTSDNSYGKKNIQITHKIDLLQFPTTKTCHFRFLSIPVLGLKNDSNPFLI